MEKNNYMQSIMNIYSKLKGAEKRVADYILKNPFEIIHMTITELSEKCKCGEATVFRLSKKLGYTGFQQLKISIASENVEPIKNVHWEIKKDDDITIIKQKVFNSTINSLKETLNLNDSKNLNEAIKILSESNKKVFYGMGGSSAIALDAYHKFLKIDKDCIYHSDSHFQAMLSASLNEKDCILAISNTGSNKELIENLKIAKENNTKIISITSNIKSPIAKVSDIILIAYGKENDFKSEASESRISALTLIDTIFVGSCLKKKDDYFCNLEKIRNSISKKRF
ncbi:MurR/RpiR family transcriptional regulator [Oceanotoga sp. DSM 15011]|jgi:DNA-binding MurR/RpiR family transcriptional regulator|uniref:RpiR family transcriptional regulator n=1 Tax=Oceanotoga teriensis TaxID=515440 RepID=A0AA45C555_9BACT|nr:MULTISPECIES: MurR/RpiR family transcriptional regulator [Oceanotoga]MDN5341955.1 hypothetical protein [Oceanotoga sp.]MDO7976527.1 MurR/RpiR family transcriptional regulator [Oceanotoga teriensis]PWJ87885.1 RpiR family transcriptional regulator [Oceanotoga teriensis]UYO99242.1 MurR/RpiR family transcriptional regulator [Oceanotoga sp. DSM 15011]